MTRRLALSLTFCLAVAAPALAQTHPDSHSQGAAHDSSTHSAVDPSEHAAMHGLLLGTWTGTSSSSGPASGKLDMVIATDKSGKMTLKMTGDKAIRAGASSGVAVEGHTLHWGQVVSGASCHATAVVNDATPVVPETMKGSMACDGREITFALQKTNR